MAHDVTLSSRELGVSTSSARPPLPVRISSWTIAWSAGFSNSEFLGATNTVLVCFLARLEICGEGNQGGGGLVYSIDRAIALVYAVDLYVPAKSRWTARRIFPRSGSLSPSTKRLDVLGESHEGRASFSPARYRR